MAPALHQKEFKKNYFTPPPPPPRGLALLHLVFSMKKFSGRSAFCINEIFYTYAELAKHVSKIRKALQILSPEGKNIGLVANDDIETYASIYALWLEGLAYVPLHPLQPLARNQEIIELAEIKTVLSSNATSFSLVKMIETNSLIFEDYLLELKETDDNSLACILFTSGSTGVPKGVPLTHRNVNSLVQSFWDAGFKVDETDRFLQPADLTYVVSIMTYFMPALIGACAYTVPHDQIKPTYIWELLKEQTLTYAFLVPSVIRHLRPYFDEISLPSLRYSVFAGEPLYLDLAQEWSKCVPNAAIDNVYGSTETTGMCFVYHTVMNSKDKSHNGVLSIGKPLAENEMIIVDDDNMPVPNGTRGVLAIAGNQITPGYWKNPDMDKKVFFVYNNTRFYRIGDICYKDEDGDILICGRADSQIKVQGIRVELGEIEYHARQFLSGSNAACVATNDSAGNTKITLFVELLDCNSKDLLKYLRSKLPSYMIPSNVICCPQFPLNANGKIDKNTLKGMVK